MSGGCATALIPLSQLDSLQGAETAAGGRPCPLPRAGCSRHLHSIFCDRVEPVVKPAHICSCCFALLQVHFTSVAEGIAAEVLIPGSLSFSHFEEAVQQPNVKLVMPLIQPALGNEQKCSLLCFKVPAAFALPVNVQVHQSTSLMTLSTPCCPDNMSFHLAHFCLDSKA